MVPEPAGNYPTPLATPGADTQPALADDPGKPTMT
jgi:hypothetical protein